MMITGTMDEIPNFDIGDENNEKIARMRYRKNKKRCLIYPEMKIKQHWDFLVSFGLIVCAIIIPYRVALVEVESTGWDIINYTIDFIFLIDIIITFNQAYYDHDFKLVDSRKAIAKNYTKSWLLFDILAVIPFRLIVGNISNLNGVVKIARISRIYKLVKLARLLRLFKVIKESSKLGSYMKEYVKMGIGFERLAFFIIIFIILCHIVTCLWILTASFREKKIS